MLEKVSYSQRNTQITNWSDSSSFWGGRKFSSFWFRNFLKNFCKGWNFSQMKSKLVIKHGNWSLGVVLSIEASSKNTCFDFRSKYWFFEKKFFKKSIFFEFCPGTPLNSIFFRKKFFSFLFRSNTTTFRWTHRNSALS